MGVEIISAFATGFDLLVLTAHDSFYYFDWYVLFQLYDPHKADLGENHNNIIVSQQGVCSHRNQHLNIQHQQEQEPVCRDIRWPAQTLEVRR